MERVIFDTLTPVEAEHYINLLCSEDLKEEMARLDSLTPEDFQDLDTLREYKIN